MCPHLSDNVPNCSVMQNKHQASYCWMLFCSARALMAACHSPVNKLDLQMRW